MKKLNKMKKVTFTLTFLLICFIGANKGYSQLKHVQGINAIGANYGIVKDGFGVNLVYTNYLRSDMIVKGGFIYEKVNFKLSSFDAYYLNPEFHYTLTNLNYILFLNAKGGLFLGYETTNNAILKQSINNFIFGESFGLSTEILLSSKLFLNVDLEQRIFQMSKTGNASMILKVGINYNL